MTRSQTFPRLIRGTGIAGAAALAVWAGLADGPGLTSRSAPMAVANTGTATVGVSQSDAPFPEVQLAGPIPARIIHIVDGDTVEARVQVWLGQDVITKVRLRGIDAPEINGACGREREQAIAARERLAAMLARQTVWLTDIGRDKYFGRVVARLVDLNGDDFGDRLMREGLARRYDGGKRAGWCRWGS